MVYRNCRCDWCDAVKPECIGLGDSIGGIHVDVIAMCLQCLKVGSVEEYEQKKAAAEEAADREWREMMETW